MTGCVLKQTACAAYLDLHHVRLLLTEANLGHLSVREHTDDQGVLLELLQLLCDALALTVLLCILGEGLLLGLVPDGQHAQILSVPLTDKLPRSGIDYQTKAVLGHR